MAGNANSGGARPKPFADALRMEIAAAGEDHKKLREIAAIALAKAVDGDMQAIQFIADRTDGKVPQAHVGGDEDDNPLRVIAEIRRVIVDAKDGHRDSPRLPAPAEPSSL